MGHLGRWGLEPLTLLSEGAQLAPVFELRLWRRAIVGYRPDFNRLVLRDLDTFRSRGSLSALTPYLNGGIVLTDVPAHGPRRAQLNPPMSRPALGALQDLLSSVASRQLPSGRFDALAWAGTVVRSMLNAAFFAGRVDDTLLDAFFRPLHRSAPHPFLPRPFLHRRLQRAIEAEVAAPAGGTLTAALAGIDEAAEEIRIALAAGYDTTAHTLAWAMWHLADSPQWRVSDALPAVIDETLRLYPAGWLGSRVTSRGVEIGETSVPAGTLVLYSPYLTHRDPELWADPLAFRPQRFTAGRPAWGFIPFSAGPRTCLGAHLARAMLLAALEPFTRGDLRAVSPRPTPTTGLTLRPRGPVLLSRPPATGGSISTELRPPHDH